MRIKCWLTMVRDALPLECDPECKMWREDAQECQFFLALGCLIGLRSEITDELAEVAMAFRDQTELLKQQSKR